MSHLEKGIVRSMSCVPSCLLYAYLLCTESSTVLVLVAAKNMGIQNVQQFEHSYIVLLYVTVICTHTELLNDINNAQLYHVTV
jgi:hypothetical protein